MQDVENCVNRAMEALGCGIRAKVENGDMVVRDLVLIDDGEGFYLVYEVSNPETPAYTLPAGDPSAVAGVVALHIARRLIMSALE